MLCKLTEKFFGKKKVDLLRNIDVVAIPEV